MKTRKTWLSSRTAGFTLIELVIAVVVAGILMTYAVPRLTESSRRRTARNARDVFAWMAQRARARAIQTGKTQLLQINPATERVWIVARGTTDTLDSRSINFQTEYDATLWTTSNSLITVCYSPRGYAFKWGASCNQDGVNTYVNFTAGGFTSKAELKPTGQVERPTQ